MCGLKISPYPEECARSCSFQLPFNLKNILQFLNEKKTVNISVAVTFLHCTVMLRFSNAGMLNTEQNRSKMNSMSATLEQDLIF